ncbi:MULTISPECIES: DMT family transporter [Vibrio harveyi group]|uniref:DMT family transporter n=1 Tax=Vibrio harveyi group TaxID=717610 RepID=UPI001F078AB4|nr:MULTISPECIES: multidrug efflux SMR transporter [Vibrio harveyi group]MEA5376652.1 multidrug efflux SMR transporter [Vibrio parahaemolyticus]UMM06726.1 multidrug efflux SMR transporter [Vibrio campbellii]
MNDNMSPKTLRTSSKHEVPSSAWLLLGIAVACEIAGALGLRFSEGFTLPLPTGIALAAFTLALYLVSHVMKQLPVSIAYPIWAGGGTAGVALIGILVLGEALNVIKALGILLVVVGVILVNRTSEKTSGC